MSDTFDRSQLDGKDREQLSEIASALGLSVGSVGTTLSRARRRLVEVYESLQQEQRGSEAGGAHGA